jgi:hypothetical protein
MNEIWKEILNNKKQCASWSSEEINPHVIDEILNEIHLHCNSKQNLVPLELHVLDWSNPEIRSLIFESTIDYCGGYDHTNTQTLAPYIFVFFPRDVLDFDYKYQLQISAIEIGIHAMFTALSATAKGLSVGFCKCFNDEKTDEVMKYFNSQYRPGLILGIGKYEEKVIQENPHTGTEHRVYVSSAAPHYNHIKPDAEIYIKKHY